MNNEEDIAKVKINTVEELRIELAVKVGTYRPGDKIDISEVFNLFETFVENIKENYSKNFI